MSYFRQIRNIELSVLYYLETQLAADWSGVTLVKNFLDAYDTDVPVVAVSLGEIDSFRREIGSTSLVSDCTLLIDIFAKSDGQRLDLTDWIINKLTDGCVYYEHSHQSGSPTTLVRTANGRVAFLGFLSNVHIEPDERTTGLDIHEKYRQFISSAVRKIE